MPEIGAPDGGTHPTSPIKMCLNILVKVSKISKISSYPISELLYEISFKNALIFCWTKRKSEVCFVSLESAIFFLKTIAKSSVVIVTAIRIGGNSANDQAAHRDRVRLYKN